MNGRRTVFFVSDSTGITAETVGNSILAQFDGVEFDAHRLAFVDTEDKARVAPLRITAVYGRKRHRVWWHGDAPCVPNMVSIDTMGRSYRNAWSIRPEYAAE